MDSRSRTQESADNEVHCPRRGFLSPESPWLWGSEYIIAER